MMLCKFCGKEVKYVINNQERKKYCSFSCGYDNANKKALERAKEKRRKKNANESR